MIRSPKFQRAEKEYPYLAEGRCGRAYLKSQFEDKPELSKYADPHESNNGAVKSQ